MSRLLACLCALFLVPAAIAQTDPTEYVKQVNKFLEFDDFQGLGKYVKEQQELTLVHFAGLCWERRRSEDESRDYIVDALKKAWGAQLQTDTLREYEEYIAKRPYKTRSELLSIEGLEPEVWELFEEGRQKRDRKLFELGRDKAMELARHYEHLGHPLHAGRMWSVASQISQGFPDVTLEERRDAIYFMGNFLRLREEWYWTTDDRYTRNKSWHREQLKRVAAAEEAAAEREREGYDPSVKGIEALILPKAKEEIAPLEFRVMRKDHVSPFAFGGAIPPLWLSGTVQGEGPAKFLYFQDKDLYLVRPGSSKFGVTINGSETDMDKNPWEEISPSPKFKPTVVHLGPNKTEPYALWFFIGSGTEPVHGFSHNLAPQEVAIVNYKSAKSRVTTIGGETVTLDDDNSNAKLFETDPFDYGLLDRTRPTPGSEGSPVPAYDSMQIGKGTLQPWSNFVSIGGAWFHLRPHDEGKKIGARPVNPKYFKVGKVKMDWTGPRQASPEVVIIEGTELQGARYDVASAKEIEVPVGMYQIAFGRIASGKGARALEAHIYPGSREPFEVKADETAEVKLGGPFYLDFDRDLDGVELKIDAMKIAVMGATGERYSRIHGAVPTPDVLVSKSKDGKKAKTVGSFRPMNLDLMVLLMSKHPTFGLELGYFAVPKGSQGDTTVLEVKLPYKSSFIGLREKKNKLFGKLDPVFK